MGTENETIDLAVPDDAILLRGLNAIGDPQAICQWVRQYEKADELAEVARTLDCLLSGSAWGMTEVAGRVEAIHGEASLREFAKEIGRSQSTIYKWRSVYQAFPDDEARDYTLSFECHYVAAQTDDPAGNLKMASEGRFTAKQLRDALPSEEGEPSELPAPPTIEEFASRLMEFLREVAEAGLWTDETRQAFVDIVEAGPNG